MAVRDAPGLMDETLIREERADDEIRAQLYEALRAGRESAATPKTKSIVRAQKLINKLKRFNDAEKDAVVAGLEELDVSMFLAEIANALCDVSNIKSRDIPALVRVCGVLQVHYGSDFIDELKGGLRRAQETSPGQKQRLLVRLGIELALCGVLEDDKEVLAVKWILDWMDYVGNVGRYVTVCRGNSNSGMLPAEAQTNLPNDLPHWAEYGNLQTIEFVVKRYAKACFGLQPVLQRQTTPWTDPSWVPSRVLHQAQQAKLKAALEKYVRQKSILLLFLVHEALFQQETINQQQRIQRVTLDPENEGKLQVLQQLKERVTGQLNVLYEALGITKCLHLQSVLGQLTRMTLRSSGGGAEQGPADGSADDYPTDFYPRVILESMKLICPLLNENYLSPSSAQGGITRMNAPAEEDGTSGSNDPYDPKAIEIEVKWADMSERGFYEVIPNLRDFIPSALLGTNRRQEVPLAPEVDDDGSTAGMNSPEVGRREESDPEEVLRDFPSGASPTTHGEERPLVSKSPIDKFIESFLHFATTCGFVDTDVVNQVDAYVRDFCFKQLNGKQNRKRLAKAFLNTKKSDLHVLPLVCRFTRVLGSVYADVQQTVVSGVLAEFNLLKDEKSPFKIEQKIKTVRFLGELCKFEMVAVGSVLTIMGQLVEDFTPHNVEMLCALLETCGRFVAGSRGADVRLHNLLTRINRLKSSKTVVDRLSVFLEEQLLILEAACRRMRGEMPALWARAVRGVCQDPAPPMKLFIEHLVWDILIRNWDTTTTANHEPNREIVKLFRKLDWKDRQVVSWLLETFLDVNYQVNVDGLSKFSMCLGGLAGYQAQFAITCIDELVERIVVGLEENEASQRQMRLFESRLLTELFTDRLIDSYVIMDILYFILGIHTTPTPFGASHFKTLFALVKQIGTSPEVQAVGLTAEVRPDAPPLDYVLALLDLPALRSGPVPSLASGHAIPSVSEDTVPTSTATTQSGTGNGSEVFPNRLAEMLYDFNLKSPLCAADLTARDFFRVRLACHIIKGSWKLVTKRSWRWRLELFYHCLVYYVSWRANEAEDSLPVDIDFTLKESLGDFNPAVYAKLNFKDRFTAAGRLAASIGEIAHVLQEVLLQPGVAPSSADSLLSGFYSRIVIQESAGLNSSSMTDEHGNDSTLLLRERAATESRDGSKEDADENEKADGDDERGSGGYREDEEDNTDEEEEENDEKWIDEEDEFDEEGSSGHGRNALSTIQFDRDLDGVVSESVEAARSTAQYLNMYSKAAGELRLPHHLLKNRTRNVPEPGVAVGGPAILPGTLSAADPGATSANENEDNSPTSYVKFTLVTKRGPAGKFAIKQMMTTADSHLARALTKTLPEVPDDSLDRQLNKRFVMDHVDRIGAEEQRTTDYRAYKSVLPDDRPVLPSASPQQRLVAAAYQVPGGMRSASSGQARGKRPAARTTKTKPIREAVGAVYNPKTCSFRGGDLFGPMKTTIETHLPPHTPEPPRYG